MMSVSAMAVAMPVSADVQVEARPIAVSAIIIRIVAVVPVAAAMQMAAMAPAAPAVPYLLRQSILACCRCQTTCRIAERHSTGRCRKHAQRSGARRSTQPIQAFHRTLLQRCCFAAEARRHVAFPGCGERTLAAGWSSPRRNQLDSCLPLCAAARRNCASRRVM